MTGELQPGDPRSVGPYRLPGRLGSGGMGQVFLGRSAGGRLVAVRVIRPDLGGEPPLTATPTGCSNPSTDAAVMVYEAAMAQQTVGPIYGEGRHAG